jgi:hypothetical protein
VAVEESRYMVKKWKIFVLLVDTEFDDDDEMVTLRTAGDALDMVRDSVEGWNVPPLRVVFGASVCLSFIIMIFKNSFRRFFKDTCFTTGNMCIQTIRRGNKYHNVMYIKLECPFHSYNK